MSFLPNSSPTPPVRTAYLDQSARGYDELRFTTPAGRAIHETEIAMLHPLIASLPAGANVLEVGCGTGRFLVEVAAAGLRVEGLDASPDMLEETRTKLAARGLQAALQLGECVLLPFADSTFDFVYCIRVLNQTESADYALSAVREMLRVTRPGGRALVEFISAERPSFRRGSDVRLLTGRVVKTAATAQGRLEWLRGIFFFGMTAQLRVPAKLRGALTVIDRALGQRLPQYCARSYALFRKDI